MNVLGASPREVAVEETDVRPPVGPGNAGAGVASVRGRRAVAADAAVIAGHGSGTAMAVADGIGDTEGAARAARIAASTAVRVAPGSGTRAALLAARDAVDADPAAGDAVLVVAAGLPGGGWTVSWVGDCRALLHDGASDGPATRELTHDHTMAEELRALGVPAGGNWENVVTTTVATADPRTAGHLWAPPGAGTLVLVSDGVHRPLGADGMAAVLDAHAGTVGGGPVARALVAAALEAGGTDNATAAVLALPREWAAGPEGVATVRIPHPRTA